jgi:predicted ATPase
MIKRFRVQNFKILKDVSMDLAPVNVLIGPNGAGKSAILQALDFLRAFFMSSIDVYLQQRGWDYKDIPNVHGKTKSIQWEISVELQPDPSGRGAGRYDYFVSVSPKRYLAIGREELHYTDSAGKTTILLKRAGRSLATAMKGETINLFAPNFPAGALVPLINYGTKDSNPEIKHFVNWVQRLRQFEVWDPKSLRSADRGKHFLLGSSGEHLAPVLANLKERKPQDFQRLIARVRKFFPHLIDISFSGKGWGWRAIRLHEKRADKEITLNPRQVSDGMLRLLALTSFLFLDNIPSVLMFEEPENGMHPHVLREMVQIMKELTLRKAPNQVQVVLTTHSPYVLDEFYDHPECVWLVDVVHKPVGTQVVRLSDKSQLKSVKEAFGSLGEAWFANAIGANPPAVFLKQ